jgi:hypothetical protein
MRQLAVEKILVQRFEMLVHDPPTFTNKLHSGLGNVRLGQLSLDQRVSQ